MHFDVDEIAMVPCFAANEIGSARENNRVRIFEKNDPFVEDSIASIITLFSTLLNIPREVEGVITQYSRIMAIDIKKFKHDYKVNDYPIE